MLVWYWAHITCSVPVLYKGCAELTSSPFYSVYMFISLQPEGTKFELATSGQSIRIRDLVVYKKYPVVGAAKFGPTTLWPFKILTLQRAFRSSYRNVIVMWFPTMTSTRCHQILFLKAYVLKQILNARNSVIIHTDMRPHGKAFDGPNSLFETQQFLWRENDVSNALWLPHFTPVRSVHLRL